MLTPVQVITRIQKFFFATLAVATMSAGSLAAFGGTAYADGGGGYNANAPAAPASISSVTTSRTITVTWTASPSNGGYAIQRYEAKTEPDGKTCNIYVQSNPNASLTCVISGLENGKTYSVCVYAINSKGQSPSTCQTGVSPAAAPAAPAAPVASYASNLISISWTAVTGATSYTVVDGATGLTTICTSSTTSCTWNGFTWGTRYSFKVKATNGAGTSTASALSNYVTPSTVPSAPLSVVATRGATKITASWQLPSTNGGSVITGYTATATPGGAYCTTTTARSCIITGLTNGTSYVVNVVASNANGPSNASDASNGAIPADVPTAPTNVTASFDGSTIRISWNASDSNGDATTTFDVYNQNGDVVCVGAASDSSCLWDGFTKGSTYYFKVTATNGVGESAKSAASATIRPQTAPDAPVGASAIAGNAKATILWTAPASNGGSAITKYTVTSTPGGYTCTTTASVFTCSISGLTNGVHYSFTVNAKNAIGTSVESDASNDVVPMTFPSAPLNVKATSTGHGTVRVDWTAPASNGGGTIFGYAVTAQPGGATCYSYDVSCNFDSLSYGTNYTFSVVATNDVGDGPSSSNSNAVIFYAQPGNPSILDSSAPTYIRNYYGLFTPGLTLNIAAPSDWGSSVGTNLGSLTLTVSGPSGQIDQQIIPVTSDGNGGVNYTNTFSYSNLAQWSSYTATLVASNNDGTSATVTKSFGTSGDLVEPLTTTLYDSSKGTLTWNVSPIKTSTDAVYTLAINGTTLCSGSADQVAKCVQKNVTTTAQTSVTTPVFTEPFSVTVNVPGLASKTWNYTEKLYYLTCGSDNSSCTRYVGNHYRYVSANLRGMNLSNLDLQGSTFWSANLTSAVLDGADLSASYVQNSDLTAVQAWGTNFTGAYLLNDGISRARFVNPNFTLTATQGLTGTPYWLCGVGATGATWSSFPANLSHASESGLCRIAKGSIIAANVKLSGVDISNTDLSNLNLGAIQILNSNLNGVNFSNVVTNSAIIVNSSVAGANFAGATFTGLTSRALTGTPSAFPASYAIRSGFILGPTVNLTFRDMQGLDLSGLNLTGAVLANDDLRGANFSNTNLTNVNFGPVTALGMPGNLSNPTRLSGANFSGATMQLALLLGSFPSSASGQWLAVSGSAPASLPSNLRFDSTNGRLVIK